MRNPLFSKLVALAERIGDSERFKRAERETEKIIAEAKVKVDQILAESATKSEQILAAAHAAKAAYHKETAGWEPAAGDHVTLDAEGVLDSLRLTDVTVSIEKAGKRGSKITITTKDGATVTVKHTGSASLGAEENLPLKPKKRRAQS